MRKAAIIAVVVTLLSMLMAASPKNEPQTKTLTGQVTDKADAPLSGAVVYLQNSRTQAVKTFITGRDGNYRFSALSPNVDYQVYAEYQGHRSDSKTLSSFDSRSNVVLHLKVNLAK
jgi:protocatechuate 3,4-dioxygenase beta subunit